MWASTRMVSVLDRGRILSPVVKSMLEDMSMANAKVEADSKRPMEEYTKENGKQTNAMVCIVSSM